MKTSNGTLYIVATPIGNLSDISYRAVETLRQVARIYAEDTRNSIKLLTHYEIRNQLSALHDHNEASKINEIALLLAEDNDIALISDAGTPLISDPGYKLVRELAKQGFNISPIPGASAMTAALSVAGLPTDKFTFEGFLPAKKSARIKALEKNKIQSYTQVYYESSHRIIASVATMCEVMGEEREVCLAREITKLYEQIFRGTLQGLLAWLEEDSNHQRGEFVVVLAGHVTIVDASADRQSAERLLTALLPDISVKKSASIVAKLTSFSKNEAYKIALEINGRS